MTPAGPRGDQAADATDRARRSAARGASSVALSRLGALVDLVSQPAYTWMFGLPTYGLYMVLWSLVNVAENIFDLGTTSALQRILPRSDDPDERARAVRAALLLGVTPNLAVAIGTFLAAPWIAARLNVDAVDLPRLVTAVRIFAWALPLWALVEVTTSAVRACHAFGPEVRLRLVWEQLTRLGAAAALWAAGVDTLGLIVAHLVSLSVTSIRSLKLLDRYVPLRRVAGVRTGRAMAHDMLLSGVAVLPSNILGRVFSDVATVAANLLAPGAAGASAAALYAIARKVASVPQIVRQTFGYVLGPIAAAARAGDRETLQGLYDFALRLSMLLALPTCAGLIAAAPALLALFAKGAEAAWPVVAILTAARGIEAAVGPASAIQQVIGRRARPAINSLVALAMAVTVGAALAWALPQVAVAWAVATGQVAVAGLSIGQLRREEGLRWGSPANVRSLAVALAGCVVLFALGALLLRAPRPVLGAAEIAAWGATLWMTMRLGLHAADKRALGKAGRLLRL